MSYPYAHYIWINMLIMPTGSLPACLSLSLSVCFTPSYSRLFHDILVPHYPFSPPLAGGAVRRLIGYAGGPETTQPLNRSANHPLHPLTH